MHIESETMTNLSFDKESKEFLCMLFGRFKEEGISAMATENGDYHGDCQGNSIPAQWNRTGGFWE